MRYWPLAIALILAGCQTSTEAEKIDAPRSVLVPYYGTIQNFAGAGLPIETGPNLSESEREADRRWVESHHELGAAAFRAVHSAPRLEVCEKAAVPLDTPAPAESPVRQPAPAAVVIGLNADAVDAVFQGWTRQEDRLSTQRIKVIRYSSDVTVIVHLVEGKAVGADVIDNPGAGATGISAARFDALVRLVGGEPRDVNRDEHGVRDFSIGDVSYDD